MNKRVKIVATLGPRLKSVAAKNLVKMVTGVKNLTVKHLLKTLLN